MPPQLPPDYGYGPINYANQYQADPFASFDTRIRYNDMVRHQMISQYAQNTVRPATMSLAQSRFQYGTGGQDSRHYQRQAEMSRLSYGSSAATMAADMGFYGAGAVATGAMGIGAWSLAGVVAPLAATLAPMHFINKGVQNALDRRTFMHSIASDVEQYRGRLGFNNNLSYGEASLLGNRMERSMSSPGQFFSKNQQMRIHKIGLANDLLSAKGSGMDSGTINQYERNFEELKETTEEVVKLLQTTIEGGMSVIKELQQKGFGNIKQIRQQVLQAKAFGGITGLGAQNMMNIGAAGAQAVQGTPWEAGVGAGMYQFGAAQAHLMSQGNPGMARAVRMAGGTAQAGGIIANSMMNLMSSGIGTKMAAFAMNPDGTVNNARLSRLMSGDAGAYEISSGANSVGYRMGSGKVRFQMFKEDLMNRIGEDPAALANMARSGFNAWAGQKRGNIADKAYAFAGMVTNNSRDQRLFYESLIGNPNLGRMQAGMMAEQAALNKLNFRGDRGFLTNALSRISGGAGRFTDAIGEGIVSTVDDMSRGFGTIGRGFTDAFYGVAEELGQRFGLVGKYGIDRGNIGGVRSAVSNLYGTGRRLSKRGFGILSSGGGRSARSISGYNYSDKEIDNLISSSSERNFAAGLQDVITMVGNESYADAIKNESIRSTLGIRSYEKSVTPEDLKSRAVGLINKLQTSQNSYKKKFENANSNFNSELINEKRTESSRKALNDARVDMYMLNMQDLSAQEKAVKQGRALSSLDPDDAKMVLDLESARTKANIPTMSYIGGVTDVAGARARLDKVVSGMFNANASMPGDVMRAIYSGGSASLVKPDPFARMVNQGMSALGLKGDDARKDFLRRLNEAKSNVGATGEAADASDKFVKTLMDKGVDIGGFLKGNIGVSQMSKFMEADYAHEASLAVQYSRGVYRPLVDRYAREGKFKSKQESESFFGNVRDIASGRFTQEKWEKFRGDSSQVRHLEKMFGTVRGLFSSKGMSSFEDFQKFALSEEGLSSLDPRTQSRARVDRMTGNILELTKLIKGESDQVTILDGDKEKKLTDSEKDIATAKQLERKMRLDRETEMHFGSTPYRADSQSTTLDNTVRPPVLNYWNNRWVL